MSLSRRSRSTCSKTPKCRWQSFHPAVGSRSASWSIRSESEALVLTLTFLWQMCKDIEGKDCPHKWIKLD